MSTRYISVEEINSVQAALSDNEGIELLKKIKDNLNKEDTEKEEKEFKKFNENKANLSGDEIQKQSDEISERRAFIGFAKEEDLGIKDSDNKDASKLGTLNRLADKGLVLKGGYIPKNKARVNSYKLTNEGYALLALFEKVKEGKQEDRPPSPSPNQRQQQQSSRR